MKALSIQSPWSWLISNGYKDIENRRWSTTFRGRVFIHAGKREDENFDWSLFKRFGIQAPATFERGGIVGIATIVDVVTRSGSPWFCGLYGFVLKDAQPLPFVPLRGQLGFFDVPDEIVKKVSI